MIGTTPSCLADIYTKCFVKLWSGKSQSSNLEEANKLILHKPARTLEQSA